MSKIHIAHQLLANLFAEEFYIYRENPEEENLFNEACKLPKEHPFSKYFSHL